MVDRSASLLPRFLSEGVLGNLMGGSPPSANKLNLPEGVSRGFVHFLLSVKKAKSKHDESQIVQRELETIQANITQPNLAVAQTRDYLCRLIYCDMLGYDVSFGGIHAIKLTQQGSHFDKKIGYLSCCLLLHRDHELILLLVNTIQKDLKSSNLLDNLIALNACSQLVPVEMIPSVLPLVLDKLKHTRELVRHKAVLCLYQFQLLAPELLEHCHDSLKRALFDKDPGVMAAAVHIVQCSIERDATKCKDLAASLISIMNQILSRRMTSLFDFHSVPFPWLQIQILKCLAMLASAHESLTESLIPLLKKILQASSIKENIAFSLLYECIRCIVSINAPKSLLDETMQHVERFLLSNNPNLKFIGVKLLVLLVQVNPEYSVNYQKLIVQSLENGNINIQKKMHKLLYQIANEANVKVVCSKLMLQLKSSTDKYWRSEVIMMIFDLIERFDTDGQWEVDMVFSCLQQGNEEIHDKTQTAVMNMLEKKFIQQSGRETGQKVLVQRCVRSLVNKEVSSCIHLSAWVLGELAPFLRNMPDDKVISLFTQHLANQSLPYVTHSCIVTALQQLVVKGVVQRDAMATKIKEVMTPELSTVIKQRLSVILGVCAKAKNVRYIVHTDDVDTTFTFLDNLVCDDLENEGCPFIPTHLRGISAGSSGQIFSLSAAESLKTDESSSTDQPSSTSSSKLTEEQETGLKLPGVKKVWGKEGRIDNEPSPKITTQSLAEGSGLTEEEARQKELASALFGGFQEKSKNLLKEDGDDVGGFKLSVPDKAGWRSLHALADRVKPQLEAVEFVQSDVEHNKAGVTESKEMKNELDKHIDNEEGSVDDKEKWKNLTDLKLADVNTKKTEDENPIREIETDLDNVAIAGEDETYSGKFDNSDFDLDQALSALIDSNVVEDTASKERDMKQSVLQFGVSDYDDDSVKVCHHAGKEESLYSGYEEFENETDFSGLEENSYKAADEQVSLYTSDS